MLMILPYLRFFMSSPRLRQKEDRPCFSVITSSSPFRRNRRRAPPDDPGIIDKYVDFPEFGQCGSTTAEATRSATGRASEEARAFPAPDFLRTAPQAT